MQGSRPGQGAHAGSAGLVFPYPPGGTRPSAGPQLSHPDSEHLHRVRGGKWLWWSPSLPPARSLPSATAVPTGPGVSSLGKPLNGPAPPPEGEEAGRHCGSPRPRASFSLASPQLQGRGDALTWGQRKERQAGDSMKRVSNPTPQITQTHHSWALWGSPKAETPPAQVGGDLSRPKGRCPEEMTIHDRRGSHWPSLRTPKLDTLAKAHPKTP